MSALQKAGFDSVQRCECVTIIIPTLPETTKNPEHFDNIDSLAEKLVDGEEIKMPGSAR